MRINPIVYGVAVLTVFFGIMLGFQTAGVWSTSGRVTTSGDQVQPSSSDLESIKGWMTLDQISITFNVPFADLLNQFELPADTSPSTAIKDLETDLFSVTNLRTWLATLIQPGEQASIPITETSQPQPTIVQSETTTASPTITVVTAATPAAFPMASTEHVVTDKTITGKTTFQEVLDWGVPAEVIEQVIGDTMPSFSTVIKDYVTAKGMQFTTIKSMLQSEIDKTQ